MYTAKVEILSDAINYAVMRHPDRRFPGSLVQGDSLAILCGLANEACAEAWDAGARRAFESMDELRNELQDRLNHYKAVLAEHDIDLPFFGLPPEDA